MADRNSGAQERQGEEKREAGSTCRPHSGEVKTRGNCCMVAGGVEVTSPTLTGGWRGSTSS